jgi:hypothetical protein
MKGRTNIAPVHAGVLATTKPVAPPGFKGPVAAELTEPAQKDPNLVRVACGHAAVTAAASRAVVPQRGIRVGSDDDPIGVQHEDPAPEILR